MFHCGTRSEARRWPKSVRNRANYIPECSSTFKSCARLYNALMQPVFSEARETMQQVC